MNWDLRIQRAEKWVDNGDFKVVAEVLQMRKYKKKF